MGGFVVGGNGTRQTGAVSRCSKPKPKRLTKKQMEAREKAGLTPILTVGQNPSDKRNTDLEGEIQPKRQRKRKNPNEPKGPRAMKARKLRDDKKKGDSENATDLIKKKLARRLLS